MQSQLSSPLLQKSVGALVGAGTIHDHSHNMLWPNLLNDLLQLLEDECTILLSACSVHSTQKVRPLGSRQAEVEQRSALHICPAIAQESKACDSAGMIKVWLELLCDIGLGTFQ